ncbi:hypothetical protein QOT17_000337 [Balamuthia mandrillaris]
MAWRNKERVFLALAARNLRSVGIYDDESNRNNVYCLAAFLHEGEYSQLSASSAPSQEKDLSEQFPHKRAVIKRTRAMSGSHLVWAQDLLSFSYEGDLREKELLLQVWHVSERPPFEQTKQLIGHLLLPLRLMVQTEKGELKQEIDHWFPLRLSSAFAQTAEPLPEIHILLTLPISKAPPSASRAAQRPTSVPVSGHQTSLFGDEQEINQLIKQIHSLESEIKRLDNEAKETSAKEEAALNETAAKLSWENNLLKEKVEHLEKELQRKREEDRAMTELRFQNEELERKAATVRKYVEELEREKEKMKRREESAQHHPERESNNKEKPHDTIKLVAVFLKKVMTKLEDLEHKFDSQMELQATERKLQDARVASIENDTKEIRTELTQSFNRMFEMMAKGSVAPPPSGSRIESTFTTPQATPRDDQDQSSSAEERRQRLLMAKKNLQYRISRRALSTSFSGAEDGGNGNNGKGNADGEACPLSARKSMKVAYLIDGTGQRIDFGMDLDYDESDAEGQEEEEAHSTSSSASSSSDSTRSAKQDTPYASSSPTKSDSTEKPKKKKRHSKRKETGLEAYISGDGSLILKPGTQVHNRPPPPADTKKGTFAGASSFSTLSTVSSPSSPSSNQQQAFAADKEWITEGFFIPEWEGHRSPVSNDDKYKKNSLRRKLKGGLKTLTTVVKLAEEEQSSSTSALPSTASTSPSSSSSGTQLRQRSTSNPPELAHQEVAARQASGSSPPSSSSSASSSASFSASHSTKSNNNGTTAEDEKEKEKRKGKRSTAVEKKETSGSGSGGKELLRTLSWNNLKSKKLDRESFQHQPNDKSESKGKKEKESTSPSLGKKKPSTTSTAAVSSSVPTSSSSSPNKKSGGGGGGLRRAIGKSETLRPKRSRNKTSDANNRIGESATDLTLAGREKRPGSTSIPHSSLALNE